MVVGRDKNNFEYAHEEGDERGVQEKTMGWRRGKDMPEKMMWVG